MRQSFSASLLAVRWIFAGAGTRQFQPQFLCYPGSNSHVGSRLLARVVRIAHPGSGFQPDSSPFMNKFRRKLCFVD
jgi:hypothetical protein